MAGEDIFGKEKNGEDQAKDLLKSLDQEFIKAMNLDEPECYHARKPIAEKIEKILEQYPQLREYYDNL